MHFKALSLIMKFRTKFSKSYLLLITLVASSFALVCSAIKFTQTQDLCIVEEQRLWSNVGVFPPSLLR